MPSFEITHSGANNLNIGDIVDYQECPPWLVGKCKEVKKEKQKDLEVAAPNRGRPKKD